MSEIRLYAVTEEGPRPVEPAPGSADVHEALMHVPVGVYSGLRTFGHDRFLRLDLHMARTHRSALAAGQADFDEALLRRALHAVASAWPLAEARVRFDVLAEPVRFPCGSARMLIALSQYSPLPEEFLRGGVRVQIAPELSRERPEVKTTAFVARRRPYPFGERAAYEHLMLDASDRILEGMSSNFFGVEGGALRTAGEGVLEGVTRAIVLELAAGLELSARFEPIPLAEIGHLDEAFLTSSSHGVVPVVAVAAATVGAGGPGPIGGRLRAAYERYAEREARTAMPLA